jgi:hypothetical protein
MLRREGDLLDTTYQCRKYQHHILEIAQQELPMEERSIQKHQGVHGSSRIAVESSDGFGPLAQRRTLGQSTCTVVDLVPVRLTRPHRGLDRIDLVHVNDGLLSVAADAVH